MSNKKLDLAVWVLILALFSAAIWANYHYAAEVAWAIRLAGWIILACALIGIAYLSSQGKTAWAFATASRTELRKVVWPNRQETIQSTLIVVVMVVVMAVALWGVDSILLAAVGWLTGQRG